MTDATVMVTVAMLPLAVPSLARYVNESAPWKSGAGV